MITQIGSSEIDHNYKFLIMSDSQSISLSPSKRRYTKDMASYSPTSRSQHQEQPPLGYPPHSPQGDRTTEEIHTPIDPQSDSDSEFHNEEQQTAGTNTQERGILSSAAGAIGHVASTAAHVAAQTLMPQFIGQAGTDILTGTMSQYMTPAGSSKIHASHTSTPAFHPVDEVQVLHAKISDYELQIQQYDQRFAKNEKNLTRMQFENLKLSHAHAQATQTAISIGDKYEIAQAYTNQLQETVQNQAGVLQQQAEMLQNLQAQMNELVLAKSTRASSRRTSHCSTPILTKNILTASPRSSILRGICKATTNAVTTVAGTATNAVANVAGTVVGATNTLVNNALFGPSSKNASPRGTPGKAGGVPTPKVQKHIPETKVGIDASATSQPKTFPMNMRKDIPSPVMSVKEEVKTEPSAPTLLPSHPYKRPMPQQGESKVPKQEQVHVPTPYNQPHISQAHIHTLPPATKLETHKQPVSLKPAVTLNEHHLKLHEQQQEQHFLNPVYQTHKQEQGFSKLLPDTPPNLGYNPNVVRRHDRIYTPQSEQVEQTLLGHNHSPSAYIDIPQAPKQTYKVVKNDGYQAINTPKQQEFKEATKQSSKKKKSKKEESPKKDSPRKSPRKKSQDSQKKVKSPKKEDSPRKSPRHNSNKGGKGNGDDGGDSGSSSSDSESINSSINSKQTASTRRSKSSECSNQMMKIMLQNNAAVLAMCNTMQATTSDKTSRPEKFVVKYGQQLKDVKLSKGERITAAFVIKTLTAAKEIDIAANKACSRKPQTETEWQSFFKFYLAHMTDILHEEMSIIVGQHTFTDTQLFWTQVFKRIFPTEMAMDAFDKALSSYWIWNEPLGIERWEVITKNILAHRAVIAGKVSSEITMCKSEGLAQQLQRLVMACPESYSAKLFGDYVNVYENIRECKDEDQPVSSAMYDKANAKFLKVLKVKLNTYQSTTVFGYAVSKESKSHEHVTPTQQPPQQQLNVPVPQVPTPTSTHQLNHVLKTDLIPPTYTQVTQQGGQGYMGGQAPPAPKPAYEKPKKPRPANWSLKAPNGNTRNYYWLTTCRGLGEAAKACNDPAPPEASPGCEFYGDWLDVQKLCCYCKSKDHNIHSCQRYQTQVAKFPKRTYNDAPTPAQGNLPAPV
jgi:hypothetical protein